MLIGRRGLDSVESMKLAISTLCCPAWDLQQIAEAAVQSGIEGIDFRGIGTEIDITALPQFGADFDTTLRLLRERKISLPCFNTSVTLLSPSPQRWDAMERKQHSDARSHWHGFIDAYRLDDRCRIRKLPRLKMRSQPYELSLRCSL